MTEGCWYDPDVPSVLSDALDLKVPPICYRVDGFRLIQHFRMRFLPEVYPVNKDSLKSMNHSPCLQHWKIHMVLGQQSIFLAIYVGLVMLEKISYLIRITCFFFINLHITQADTGATLLAYVHIFTFCKAPGTCIRKGRTHLVPGNKLECLHKQRETVVYTNLSSAGSCMRWIVIWCNKSRQLCNTISICHHKTKKQ